MEGKDLIHIMTTHAELPLSSLAQEEKDLLKMVGFGPEPLPNLTNPSAKLTPLAAKELANELTFDEYNQLNMRTTTKLIFDFNPSDNDHWLYELLERDNSKLIKSTYLDNPFLGEDQVKEIEYLISVDENYYKIYALGEKPIPTTRIYTHFKLNQ